MRASDSEADEVWEEYPPGGGLTVERGLPCSGGASARSDDTRTYVLYSCKTSRSLTVSAQQQDQQLGLPCAAML